MPIAGRVVIDDGIRAFEEVMRNLPDCDAIAFNGDVLAVGALLQARKMEIAVPGRVAISGYGDLEFSPHVSPSLTTVHVSSYQMGFSAGQMLLKRLLDEPVGQNVVMSPIHLEVRETTSR
ncbi:MAG: hypothetical protein EOP19_31055 [Hyphomicrobiales bacterium]|nr:MAG: hypothetical protein EOP19_31055 [Hyphomicrobiales bacterium]